MHTQERVGTAAYCSNGSNETYRSGAMKWMGNLAESMSQMTTDELGLVQHYTTLLGQKSVQALYHLLCGGVQCVIR